MAANKVQFVVEAIDKATPVLDQVDKKITETSTNTVSKFGKMTDAVKNNQEGFKALGVGSSIAFGGLIAMTNSTIQANNALQNSMTGLKSIVEGTGNDFGKATNFVKEFTKDGLMTTQEASTSLKNLLAKGFNLKEAGDMMYRFKDAAAFGRQASLSLGEAVQGATEGIKNENSALVDNAGVTKNVAAMYEDYAKSINKKAIQLTDAEKRTAAYNGIMKETQLQVGDAVKATETLTGKQAMLSAGILQLQQSIGAALAPAITALVAAITPIITSVGNWINQNPQLAANIIIVVGAITGLVAAMTAIGLIIGPISAAITAIGAVIAAIGAPILIAIAAITAFAIAYKTNFLGIKDITDQVFGYIKEFLIASWEGIKVIFETSLNFLSNLWQNIWNGMKIIVEGILIAIGLVFGMAWQLITGDFSGFLSNLTVIWNYTWQLLKQGLEIAWEGIKKALELVWNGIKTSADFIWNALKEGILFYIRFLGLFFTSEGRSLIWNGFVAMFNGIGEFVSNLFNSIVNTITKAINTVTSLINKAITLANKVPGVKLPTIPQIAGAREKGGPVSSGKTYLVGERGPELFVPSSSGSIISNNKLSQNQTGNSGSQTITVNLGGVSITNGTDLDAFVSLIKTTLYQETRKANLGL